MWIYFVLRVICIPAMEDPNDSLPTNSSLQKKKSKKKKKKSGNKADQDPQETPKADQEKQPQV